MDEVKAGIQYAFQTKNPLTLALSATGHAGMEAVMANLLEAGDTILIAENGIWGQRAEDMAKRYFSAFMKTMSCTCFVSFKDFIKVVLTIFFSNLGKEPLFKRLLIPPGRHFL